MAFVGVDGCPDGWIAIGYDEDGFAKARAFGSLAECWQAWPIERLLVDVPIGLREASGQPRACDRAAREVLGPRSASVFPTPVRAVLSADSYEAARRVQRERTSKGLPAPTWGIVDRMRDADRFAREHPDAMARVHEAHPEVCWAKLAGEPMGHAKTGQPAAAAAERLTVLETVDGRACAAVRRAAEDAGAGAGVDDVLDAFALAVSASPLTGELGFLPARGEAGPERDPRGLAMEIAYAEPASQDDG